jgi:hypothetical protein
MGDDDDEQFEYGKLYVHTPSSNFDEECSLLPLKGDGGIWPDWNDGVPRKFRTKLGSPSFTLKGKRQEMAT